MPHGRHALTAAAPRVSDARRPGAVAGAAVDRLGRDTLAIFLFHGVVEECQGEVRNYTGKHLPRDVFVDVIAGLCARGRPMSLPQVVEHRRLGRPFAPGAFAVTFDDGFENNFSVAAPILAGFGVPAAFFVTSGFVDRNAMSWIDRIEHFMEVVPRGDLHLPWSQGRRHFGDRDGKIAVLEEIRRQAKSDPALDLEELVSDIFAQGGLREISSGDGPLDRKMSWEQVAELARHDLFTVGGHGHTHRILAFLSDAELEEEVSTSLRLLGEKGQVFTEHYSYPEGLPHCYSDRVIEVLKAHGIVCCPTAEDGTNAQDAGLFRLKRIPVA